jgi:signal transduction histidine kinase
MSGPERRTAAEIAWNYLDRQAAILMLRVDAAGNILCANSFARELTGLPLSSGSLGDLLITSTQLAEIKRWLTPSAKPRLMNVRTAEGLSQTLYVTSVQLGSELLLFGQADPQEQERLRREFLELNHELTALGRELALANAELTRLGALKNKFVGMASHDLKKQAGLVLNLAELLREDPAVSKSADASQILERILNSAGSMALLIDDFLDITMIEADRLSLDIQVVAQDALVGEAWDLVQSAAAKRNMELKILLDQAGSQLRVDGPKLVQVLANLLSNAIEYAPVGSSVSVVSQLQEDGIRFWVEDQGEGLDQEQQQRLFAAFGGSGASKPSGERSIGLGLAIVRKIVVAHGGTCFVESAPGRGSSFGFELPALCRAASGRRAVP